jgi:hypothetical protein
LPHPSRRVNPAGYADFTDLPASGEEALARPIPREPEKMKLLTADKAVLVREANRFLKTVARIV